MVCVEVGSSSMGGGMVCLEKGTFLRSVIVIIIIQLFTEEEE